MAVSGKFLSMDKQETENRRPLKTRDRAFAKRLAEALVERNIQPNAISVASIGFAALGASSFWIAGQGIFAGFFYLLAGIGIQGRLLCNMLDGMVAVEGGKQTPLGALYNEVPDRIADTLLLVAAGYAASGCDCLPLLGWLAAVLAMGTAYVRALGASVSGKHFFQGPMAKPHRMALLTGSCVLAIFFPSARPAIFAIALLVLNAGCLVTLYRRLKLVSQELLAR